MLDPFPVKNEILLIGPIIAHAMDQLEANYTVHRYDLAPDKDALVDALAPHLTAIATRGDYPLPATLMRRLPKLKLVASSGTGYDGIDIAAARELGITVTNSPGAAAECVADAAFGLMLATVRRIVFNDRHVRAGRWLDASVPFTDKVWGQPLGILGLGDIGKAVARRAEAFRMDIAYHGRTRQAGVAYRWFDNPVDLSRHAKILVVALPGRRGASPLVDRSVIDALGPEGYLINISRGSNVDEPYLVDALVQWAHCRRGTRRVRR